MKRIIALIIAVLLAVVFSSCTTVNNYYQQTGSAANSESVTDSKATEDKPAASSAPVDSTPQSAPAANATAFNYNTPFYGIWVSASKSHDDAVKVSDDVTSKGFNGFVETTTNWSNLNSEEWYVVTAGKYVSESEANEQLIKVKKDYPDAYVKYSGEYAASSDGGYPSFYGIWVYASKSYDEASSFAQDVSSKGFKGFVITTTDWSNLNSEKWYVVTAGKYGSEKEAADSLDDVQKYYPDAYVKYSGDHINN